MEHNKYGIGNVFSIGTQNKMNKNDEENEIENNVNKRKRGN